METRGHKSDKFRCLTNVVVVVIIDCMDVITCNTQSFSLIVVRCFCKVSWNRLSFYFPFRPEEDSTGSLSLSKLSILDHF